MSSAASSSALPHPEGRAGIQCYAACGKPLGVRTLVPVSWPALAEMAPRAATTSLAAVPWFVAAH